MDKTRVAVLLAEGFEEIEAVTIIDVLRRADLSVTTFGLNGAGPVLGSHEIQVTADAALDAIVGQRFEMVVLPGGMPGSKHLAENETVRTLLRETVARGDWVAALCAAPLALHAAGLISDGRRVTAYPAMAAQLAGAVYTGARVEVDGRIVTGAGPGAAFDFALTLVEALDSPETAASLRRAMLV
ncbi:MAG: DJ-1/PfpI family protein [Kiritimatiellaeota bacterium]|nr:DJ-1/PfpI family protein [Kiritimatiellota bacterium]